LGFHCWFFLKLNICIKNMKFFAFFWFWNIISLF
jgi:hypothetical protein